MPSRQGARVSKQGVGACTDKAESMVNSREDDQTRARGKRLEVPPIPALSPPSQFAAHVHACLVPVLEMPLSTSRTDFIEPLTGVPL